MRRNEMALSIAIDGPAGAGKSTIAKRVADSLNIVYVDTGAMYRAIALYMIRTKTDVNEELSVCAALTDVKIDVVFKDGTQALLLNGEDVNAFIRTPEVSEAASIVSSYGPVREKLVAEQRRLAQNTDMIMDGRDIGTCVLPNASLKIYLTASSAVRAKRRYLELAAAGSECDLDEIQRGIEERDERDMNREISPLRKADDAKLIDSSYMTIDEVVEQILWYVRRL